MCGLFGIIRFAGDLDEATVQAARVATATLAHRGPDNQGEWVKGGVYLGHRRLSILDLSAAAHQPFTDADGRHVLAYNGEVYNFLELRAELEKDGAAFRTASDTEVVLAMLVRHGARALTRFDGMFAAAWHDSASSRTVVFRDPMGQKPLYYAIDGDGVVFASELRALLALPGRRRIDREAFRRFLARGYYGWDETPVVGIRKLPPGCLMEIADGRVEIRRYWDSVPGRDRLDIGEDEALDEFDRLFSASCRQSMRCDVPYGVFLSGGIDSSLVLAYCHDANPGVRSFCVAMGEADFDESAKARLVSDALAIADARTFVMDQGTVTECLESCLAASDEPHGDPGWVNAYFLARSCRPHLTVALAGDGGDELFAGYAPFAGLGPVPFLRWLPHQAIALAKAAARLVPPSDRYLGLRFKLDAYMRGFPAGDMERFALWLSAMDPADIAALAGRWTGPQFPDLDAAVIPGGSQVQQLLSFYQKLFLPEFVCMHTDRAAMQVSLEVRSPLLSVPLVEFANRLPDHLKRNPGGLKWLLKRAAARHGLPQSIVAQRKQGFTFPVARWLKTTMKGRMLDLLAEGDWSDGLADPRRIRAMVDEHLSGRANHYRALYSLMVFRAWRRKYPGLEVE